MLYRNCVILVTFLSTPVWIKQCLVEIESRPGIIPEEISEKVVSNINLLDNERQFLEFIQDLSRDFEELVQFTKRIDMHMQVSEREKLEIQVREFVISSLGTDLQTAFGVLSEAIKAGTRQENLCQKFPQFKQFIDTKAWTI